MLLGSSTSPNASTLSPAGSVVSLASVASTARSHDGVFLRPDAVMRLVEYASESSVQTVGHGCRAEGECVQLRILSVCLHLEGHQEVNFLEKLCWVFEQREI
jgi:lactam utilization protein B